jgi:hypothetical protein
LWPFPTWHTHVACLRKVRLLCTIQWLCRCRYNTIFAK